MPARWTEIDVTTERAYPSLRAYRPYISAQRVCETIGLGAKPAGSPLAVARATCFEELVGVFAGSGAAPRSFFTVKASKVYGKHINLNENKNTSVVFYRQSVQGVFKKNIQGVFNLSRRNKIPPYRCVTHIKRKVFNRLFHLTLKAVLLESGDVI